MRNDNAVVFHLTYAGVKISWAFISHMWSSLSSEEFLCKRCREEEEEASKELGNDVARPTHFAVNAGNPFIVFAGGLQTQVIFVNYISFQNILSFSPL